MAGLASPIPAAPRHAAGRRTSPSGHAAVPRAAAPRTAAPLGVPAHAGASAGARTAPWRTTPGITRAGAGAVIAAAAALAAVIAVAFSGVGGGLSSIGGTEAPEVSAATGLYFSLNDMDAQVANVLLAGPGPALAAARPGYLATYARDRQAAYADLQQAAVSAAGNPGAERRLQAVLDGVGRYEALAADALLSSQQQARAGMGGAAGPGGTPPAPGYYQQATDLMRTGILPQVSSLASVSSARLDGAYAAGRAAAGTGLAVTALAGLAVLAGLIALQAFLARRFRRRVNPALVAATLVALLAATAAGGRLAAEAGHLKVARQDAFASIVALSQARAVSYAANADESRYLADPGRAAMYQRSFVAESRQLASVAGPASAGPARYQAALDDAVRAYQSGGARVTFGGYLGAEFRNITFPGERAAAAAALLAYQRYERDDGQLRALARSDPKAAAAFDTGARPGQSDWAFRQYDRALSAVIGINERAFTAAIAAGRGDAARWDGLIPAGCAALIAALVVLGVRPRLAEYRR
jgi:hypothetical protein